MSNTETANPTFSLSADQLQVLKDYAEKNGRNWKSKLNDDWYHARQPGLLQAIRNTFGPTWLTKFKFDDVKTHTVIW